jgi:glycosyltransferase involved in cell wall biosynthesis
MSKVVGCVVTKNEEEYIEMSLSGLSFLDKVFLIDNCSTDRTLSIAKKFPNVEVIKVNINLPHSVGTQRNEVLKYVKDTESWIYFCDGDEYITKDLQKSIIEVVGKNNKVGAYQIPRINYFLGKPLYNGGWYPDYQLRLIKAKYLVSWVNGPLDLPPILFDTKENKNLLKSAYGPHDKPLIKSECVVGKLCNPYLHFNHRNSNAMLDKTKRFNDSEIKYLSNTKNLPTTFSRLGVIKKITYEFLRRYFYHRGYKDGIPGFIESVYQSFSLFLLEVRKWEESLSPSLEERYIKYKKLCIKGKMKY